MNTIAERCRTYAARHVLHTGDAEMSAEEETIDKMVAAFNIARKRYELLIASDEERRAYGEFSLAWTPIGRPSSRS